jgi:hypothetical protein
VIVRQDEPGLVLITQPAHARVAAILMEAWQADGFRDRPTRDATLLATTHHDDGWIEEDAAPRWDPESRGPYDFVTLPHEPRQAIWKRAIPRIAPRSAYAAALVAQHAVTITRTSRVDPEWARFMAEMERLRDDWFMAETDSPAAAGIDPPAGDRLSFLRDYAMLAMGDLLSLVFCNGWSQPFEQEGYTFQLIQRDRLVVSPDPFGGGSVALKVSGRRLSAQAFDSAGRLRDAWEHAIPVDITGVAVGAPTDGQP